MEWSLSAASAQSNEIFINSLEKTSAPAGSTLVLSGRGFGTTQANIRVFFGGAVADISSIKDALLEVVVPAGATYGNVVVIDVSRNLRASSLEYFLPSFGGFAFDAANFAPEVEVSVPLVDPMTMAVSETPFYDVCSCDFDGDGKMDLAGAATSDLSEEIGITSLPIFPNTTSMPGATPTFGTPVEVNLGSPVRYVACADLNNDGLADIVAAQSSQGGTTYRNTLFYLQNTSSSGISFADDESFTIPDQADGCNEMGCIRNIGRIVIEDVDDDGKADLVIANRDDRFVFVYRNISTPSGIAFDAPVIVAGTDSERMIQLMV